jgi:hypothetical protein
MGGDGIAGIRSNAGDPWFRYHHALMMSRPIQPASKHRWWYIMPRVRVTPTPVPFLLPLKIMKRGICGFREEVRLGASFAFLGLVAFSVVPLGLCLAGWMIHPSEVPYVLVHLFLVFPVCGLIVWTILHDLRRTRELVIDRRVRFVSLRRLNWSGRVWHEVSSNLKDCEVRVHPIRLTVGRRRISGQPTEQWCGHALAMHLGGEVFLIGVQKEAADLHAYLATLPAEIRQV